MTQKSSMGVPPMATGETPVLLITKRPRSCGDVYLVFFAVMPSFNLSLPIVSSR